MFSGVALSRFTSKIKRPAWWWWIYIMQPFSMFDVWGENLDDAASAINGYPSAVRRDRRPEYPLCSYTYTGQFYHLLLLIFSPTLILGFNYFFFHFNFFRVTAMTADRAQLWNFENFGKRLVIILLCTGKLFWHFFQFYPSRKEKKKEYLKIRRNSITTWIIFSFDLISRIINNCFIHN